MDAYCVFVLKRRSFLFVIDRKLRGKNRKNYCADVKTIFNKQ